ncbi:DUF7507 domain-containing protein, partial [Mycetocola reblochoni]|uniref:DUF7507 domain-containing protein n=2 Tax=Mycetocola reblochoni TaxID=331618 RepID=UPI000B354E21
MPRSTDAHRRSHSPRPTLGRRARRAVAAVLTIALASVGLTATAQQAQAVTVTPMTTSYNGVVNGDFTTAGNGVLGCTGTAFSGSMTCNDLHNGSGTAGAYNDFFAMANVKQAAGFEAYSNSSTATITVPAGSTVKKAVLYWSGNTGAVAGYTGARCGTNSYSTATIPDTTAGYTSRSLKMRIGTGAIQDVPTTASRTHTENLSTQLTSGQPQYYSSSSDVTALFENAGVSGSVPISVGNIWAANGAACYAGWSLAVVYDFGSYDAANPLTTARNVLLYDGHVRKQSNEAADTVRFSGFTALTNQARIGMTLYEGDRAITGDYAQYRTSKNSTSVRIPNSQSSDTGAGGATDNIGVSHALGNQRYQGTGTGRFFNASVDVLERTVAMGGIGATSLDLDLGTTGDSYLLQNTAFSVPTGRVVIDKSFNGTADTQTLLPGEAGTFTITVTNTGGVPLRNLTVTDPLAGDCARPVPGVLGQNDSYRYTCTAPVRAGAYTNTASVVGTVDGYETQQVQDTDTTRVNSAIIDIDKSAALDDRAIAGDTATYTFALTNTGSVTLDQVAVTDPLAGLGPISYTWPGTANRLQPGQTATGTASYTLTQADIDRGYLDNTATVTGRESGGKQPSDADSNRLPIAQASAIDVVKSGVLADPAGDVAAGDLVDYTFTISNPGNTTITDVALSDALAGLGPVTIDWPGADGVLAPGQNAVATASYPLTQADLNAGRVTNSATATGTGPGGAPLTDTSDFVLPVPPEPGIDAAKTGGLPSGALGVPGEVMTFTLTGTNTGNLTLTGVTLEDSLDGVVVDDYQWPGEPGVLDPGQIVTATASYTLTQQDVDRGSVDNAVTATGNPPTGPPQTSTDTITAPVPQTPAIALDKQAAFDDSVEAEPGQPVDYTLTATNTGNVTLSGVTITDPKSGLSAIDIAWPDPSRPGVLAPGEKAVGTASYPLTQADLDAGYVGNEATATGTGPGDVEVSDSDDALVGVLQDAAIHLSKSVEADARPAVGDEIRFDFAVTNTGNVTLSGTRLSDPLVGLGPITFGEWPSGTAGVLAPGQTVTASAPYTVTQADLDNGMVSNTGTVRAASPTGDPVTDTGSATAEFDTEPSIAVSKSGALADGATGRPGDTVEYRFEISNTGDVTLSGVALDDPLEGLSDVVFGDWPGDAGVLAPGTSVTATASYTLTQADVDRGSVDNTATASGTTPPGESVSAEDSETVAIDGSARLRLDKTSTAGLSDPAAVGDVIEYAFLVENTGTRTVSDVAIDDELDGLSALVFGDWPGDEGVLAPGASVTATASYTLTQADLDRGGVTNVAVATGTAPGGDPAEPGEDSVTDPIDGSPSIVLDKTGPATAPDGTAAGDTVQYRLEARNDGNQTLTDVRLVDERAGELSDVVWSSGTAGTLEVGGTVTATATVTLTQADVDAGQVVNTATVTGTGPQGAEVDAEDAVTTTIPSAPSISIVKDGALADPDATPVRAGAVVDYRFTIENTGTVSLSDVSVTDELLEGTTISYDWSGAASEGTLAPGETITATASYAITQAQLDAGEVVNTASVSGTPPSGDPVGDEDGATVELAPQAGIALTKTGSFAPIDGDRELYAAGDTVEYLFTIENTGNVTLDGVAVTDPRLGDDPRISYDWSSTGEGRLAPGEIVTATAEYTLTQADIDAGVVRNTATVSGDAPQGGSVTDEADDELTIPAGPALQVVKSATVPEGAAAGDEVAYRFVVTNIGNVTLGAVDVSDELPGLGALVYDWSDAEAEGTLAPQQSVAATASYTLTQADLDAGRVQNTATAQGTPPTGDPVGDEDTVVTPLPASPSIGVEKSGVRAGEGAPAAGDVVDYRFVVTNTGNVTLSDVALDDPRLN